MINFERSRGAEKLKSFPLCIENCSGMVSSADTAAMRQLLRRMATKVFMVLLRFNTEVRIRRAFMFLLFPLNYLI